MVKSAYGQFNSISDSPKAPIILPTKLLSVRLVSLLKDPIDKTKSHRS